MDRLAVRFQLLSASKRNQEALDLVLQQVQVLGADPRLWVLLSAAFIQTGRWQEAEQAARSALNLEPGSRDGLMSLGVALGNQDRIGEALEAAHAVRAQFPEDPDVYSLLAQLHLHGSTRQDHEQALECILWALNLRPTGDDFAVAALAYTRLFRHEEARAVLRDGLAFDPNNRQLQLAGGSVAMGGQVVGDWPGLLSSLLAQSPMDSEAQGELRLSAFSKLRNLAYLPWLQGVVFCWLAPVLSVYLYDLFPAAADRVRLPVIAGTAVFLTVLQVVLSLGWARRVFKAYPPGYLRGELAGSRPARSGVYALVAAEAWVAGATLWAALATADPPRFWALVVLLGATVLSLAGVYLMDRAAIESTDGFTPEKRTDFAFRRWAVARHRNDVSKVPLLCGVVASLFAWLQPGEAVFGGAALVSAGAALLAFVLESETLRLRLFLARSGSGSPSTGPHRSLGRSGVLLSTARIIRVALPLAMLIGGAMILVQGYPG